MDRIEAMQVFIAALDEGSLAAAGRRLGRSPAAVSRAIAFLESHVGAELLHRTTRTLKLSEVGESYAEHWNVATFFGLRMIGGGIATLVHGLVPGFFTRTGSNTVKALYGEMRRRQPDAAHLPTPFASDQWRPEYEI